MSPSLCVDQTKIELKNADSRLKNGYFRLYSDIPVCTRINPMAVTENQICFECSTSLKGRSDKKFCSDQCRTTFNNKLKSLENRFIKDVNNILKKNRRILLKLNPEGKQKVRREVLVDEGFNFTYFTSTYTTREGSKYFYCYDQGYLPIDDDHCLLVVKKEFKKSESY